MDSEHGKQLMRRDSPELKLNFSGKNSPLLQSMYDYSIVPGEKIKKRMDYFYTPYNRQFLLRKHMTFDEGDSVVSPMSAVDLTRSKQVRHSSCLADVIEELGGAQKIITTEEIKRQSELPLAERTLGKEDFMKLEKKTWVEIKDLIFETEPQVLDYLNFHCRRWRMMDANQLKTPSK